MKIPKLNLKNLFLKGQKPNQEAFWNWIDSYWHKDEEIDQAAVKGLESTLANKLDKGVETTLLDAFNDAVSNVNSILKGEATPTSSPTAWVPGSPDLYEKWEARTVGTYINFKDGGTPPQPIEVTAADLEEKLVFINMSNGVAKKDPVPIPGAAIGESFDVSTTNKAQNAKNINDWLVNTVKGGESDETKVYNEVIGAFYKKAGIELNGTGQSSIQAGLYDVISNSTCIADANKFVTTANIRLAVAGVFRYCIGKWDGTKFNIRWESETINGVQGWNVTDFTSLKLKVSAGEQISIKCLSSSTSQIYYGDPGAPNNRFQQFSSTGNGMAQANLGSYFCVWFELKDIDLIPVESNAIFNLSKSVSNIVSEYASKGYSGSLQVEGNTTVSSDSDKISGYAINKVELKGSHILNSIDINIKTAGSYTIVTGFIEQAGKFIEKSSVTKTLVVGINTIEFKDVLLDEGDYVGLKFPGKYPVDTSPSVANLWESTDFTTALTKVEGKSLPIKLKITQYIKSELATKNDVSEVGSKVDSVTNMFVNEAKRVSLVFNPDGSVSWQFNTGYSNILHLGNSIAYHQITSYWWGSWGMASSEKSKDYVHMFLSKMKVFKPAAITDVKNIAEWEVNPSAYDKTTLNPLIIGKDLIVVRIGENASFNASFKAEYKSLIQHIQSVNTGARIVIGGVFWADNNKDTAMSQVAQELGLTFVPLKHLDTTANKSYMGAIVKGDDGQNHTVNNTGVANHPSDVGMNAIATELFNALGL